MIEWGYQLSFHKQPVFYLLHTGFLKLDATIIAAAQALHTFLGDSWGILCLSVRMRFPFAKRSEPTSSEDFRHFDYVAPEWTSWCSL